MTPRIIVPLVLIAIAMLAFWRWYGIKMRELRPDDSTRTMPGNRLTSERLRQLSSPPWRVVPEITAHLGRIDHVVVGPTGVIAIETIVLDRPDVDPSGVDDPERGAAAALARSDVDDVTSAHGVRCEALAKVYWGTPHPERPAGERVAPGQFAVEGQRLEQWLVGLPPGPLTRERVDEVWSALLTAIGRPDPRS
ncbi:nuclease-related domain-containing protein [Ilumatobacter sp.]|uniref:nuclease-related domain-containing protein n=1 Tax=Ilumatobacter sp. TaxID=1967498 RepID=UPI003B515E48